MSESLRSGLCAPAVRKSKRYKVKPAALGGDTNLLIYAMDSELRLPG